MSDLSDQSTGLLALDSAVIVGPEFLGTRGHTLRFDIGDCRNPETPVPVFISRRNGVPFWLSLVSSAADSPQERAHC